MLVEQLADALALLGLDAGGLLHDDVGVHHDEAAVGVVDEALVAGLRDEARDGLVGEADVQDRLHHAGHRRARAGADGEEQRVLRVAEPPAHDLLDLRGRLLHLRRQPRDLPGVLRFRS